ncbi:MAG: beta-glucanase (GH16 family)/PKD repeat protein [Flavobacteriales bacterium]|jgi:beta-glucanase (GH16 family)/PKD repeat protein
MKKRNAFLNKNLLLPCILLSSAIHVQAQDTPIWAEEFNEDRINKDLWTFTTGGSGFGNGELQFYTASSNNAYTDSGDLVIEAIREEYQGKEFTSARLHTNGRMGFMFGSLEARIKLPNLDKGLWPAFWMLGNNLGVDGWPKAAEWDILEAGSKAAQDAGTINTTVSGALHWWHESGDWSDWLQADHAEETQVLPNINDDYHLYQLDWTPTAVSMSVDNIPYLTLDITDPNMSEFRTEHAHILLNMAVGGFNFVDITNVGDITADFPAQMRVDYVRLYANEFTELELAEDNLASGDFGIMTETRSVFNELNWGDRANLYVWNNMTSVATLPSEGSVALAYEIAADDWWGFGLLHKDYNMRNYSQGYLHFDCKTTLTSDFSVVIASTVGSDGTVTFSQEGESYGLVRDGEWHTVSIPLNKFGGVDFETIKTFFSASGPAPSALSEIAFDNIYMSESVPLTAPEFGNFGVYTETSAHMTADNFGFGVNGDLFLWADTLTLQAGDSREGNTALDLQSNDLGWYGMGLTAREGFNLTAFDNAEANLHFSMKTSDLSEFSIGIKSGNVADIGQVWIKFSAGNDPYGFERDNQWHDIVVPMSDIAQDLNLFDVRQVFQVLGAGEVTSLAIDDIYFSGGAAAQDPGNVGIPVNRAPTAAFIPSVVGGPSTLSVTFDGSPSEDVNGDELSYSWDFGDGNVATGVNVSHDFTEEGSYKVTLTVSDAEFSANTSNYIFVDANFGQSKSNKRGLGYGNHSEEDLAAISQGLSWWYNWAVSPDVMIQDTYQDYGVEFVPMAWNGAFSDQAMRDYIALHPDVKYILAFNEPNFLEQANMTPSQAAAEWPRLEAIADEFGLKIVSVAMNYCGVCNTENGTTYFSPFEYLDDFFEVCPECRVDAISIHAYMQDAGGVEWYIDQYAKYGRPIWLTEFSEWEDNTTLDEQKNFLIQVVDSIENDADMERYAWFTGRRNGHPYNGLFDHRQSGVLTELGSIYINMPVHGAGSNIHALPKLIEAERYSFINNARVDITEDENGFLNISDVGIDAWIDYEIISENAHYDLALRVAAETAGTIEIFVDGQSHGNITVDATGSVQTWQTLDSNLDLTDGAHTFRLALSEGINVNWVKFTSNDDVGSGTDLNLALNAPAYASSIEGAHLAGNAFDGEESSRWSSEWSDSEWIYVDLGESTSIHSIVLNWEAAFGQSYDIQVSEDASQWTTVASQTNGKGAVESIDVDATGRYVRLLGLQRGTGYGYSLFEFEVYGNGTSPSGDVNKALNKDANASSTESSGMVAINAFDGDDNSRWSSAFSDSEWIAIDLGDNSGFNRVVLNWEGAYGKAYEIQTSTDRQTWTTLFTESNGDGGLDDLSISSNARYVRMQGVERGTPWGYSLWEFSVY